MLENLSVWDAVKAVASAALAVPGIVAFIWAWKDRKNRQKAESPYIVWNIDPDPDAEGWFKSEFTLLNRWDEPLYGRHVKIKGRRGAVLTIGHKLPSGVVGPDEAAASSAMPINWYFLSSSQTGASPSSGSTSLYIRPSKKTVSRAVQSGTGALSNDRNMAKLTLEVTCISASNRPVRCTAIPIWHKKIRHRLRTI